MSAPGRRSYARQPARGSLGAFAEELWVQEAPADDEPVAPTVVAPGPSLDLIFCFGDPFERLDGESAVVMPPVHVVGPRTRVMHVRATGRTGLVIARLHPWSACRLFGVPPDLLVDHHVDVGDLVAGSALATTLERVAEGSDTAARIDAVTRWLEGLLGDQPGDRLVAAAARRIYASAGAVRVGGLARALGMSSRQLRRRFRTAVGIGPKRFARVVRFQVAVGMLRAGHPWVDVVARCGFFDQAHLIAEVKEMAGITPPVVRRREETPLGSYFNREESAPYGTAYL